MLQIEGPKQVARRSDIDMNGHINNVTYLAWTQETIPLDTFLNYNLHQVCVQHPPPHRTCCPTKFSVRLYLQRKAASAQCASHIHHDLTRMASSSGCSSHGGTSACWSAKLSPRTCARVDVWPLRYACEHGPRLAQVEIDYKAECNAGDTIESLGSPVEPVSSNGSSARQHFLHTLQRSDGSGAACELVRCRTSWKPRPAAK